MLFSSPLLALMLPTAAPPTPCTLTQVITNREKMGGGGREGGQVGEEAEGK